MKYREFLNEITSDTTFLNSEALDYARYHGRRFYLTYRWCVKYLRKGDRVLSVGAGIGSIEKMLASWGAQVTVVDFPAGIEELQSYYDHLGIKTHAADLSSGQLNLPADYFDMILSSEVVEHVPVAPSRQLLNLTLHLRKKGRVLVTTPNLGSILHIGKLLFMKPILEMPEKTFGEVNSENQAVHRREYMPSEIKSSFVRAGLTPLSSTFFFYTGKVSATTLVSVIFGTLVPRFRPGMLLVGEKN